MQETIYQLNNPKAYKLFATGLFSFLISYVMASTLAPVANSSATDMISDTKISNFNVTIENPYYISITSSHATAGEPISLDYSTSGTNLGNVIVTSDTVTTETNSPLNHYLYISTNSNSNDLSSSDEANDDVISAGGGDNLASATALSNNTWGFALPSTTSGLPSGSAFDADYSSVTNNSKFAKVPTSGNEILIQKESGSGSRRDLTINTSTADIYYGTKATANLLSDTYANVIKYTAYAEQPDTTTKMIDDLEYMQDMTTEICNNSYTGMTARLKDKRGRGNAGTAEDSTYGIIKAKDGNCWMVENFDLYNKQISYADSDFTSDTFTIPASSTWADTDARPAVHKGSLSGLTDQVYYNWCAATMISTECESYEGIVSGSICPKNWMLPLENSGLNNDKTYQKLLNTYEVSKVEQMFDSSDPVYVLGFHLYAGAYLTNDVEKPNTSYYWTSRGVHDGSAFFMVTDGSNGGRISVGNGGKVYGFSVRCVSR